MSAGDDHGLVSARLNRRTRHTAWIALGLVLAIFAGAIIGNVIAVRRLDRLAREECERVQLVRDQTNRSTRALHGALIIGTAVAKSSLHERSWSDMLHSYAEQLVVQAAVDCRNPSRPPPARPLGP